MVVVEGGPRAIKRYKKLMIRCDLWNGCNVFEKRPFPGASNGPKSKLMTMTMMRIRTRSLHQSFKTFVCLGGTAASVMWMCRIDFYSDFQYFPTGLVPKEAFCNDSFGLRSMQGSDLGRRCEAAKLQELEGWICLLTRSTYQQPSESWCR